MKRSGQEKLRTMPISWRAAVAFVDQNHRHHEGSRGQKWAVGCVDEGGRLRGVAQSGRPVARAYDDGLTLEINRTCTDGVPNGNSFLYGAVRQCAWAMGYRTIITYTQEGESGASLRAAGFRLIRKIAPRKNWADSSVTLRSMRNKSAASMVGRCLWADTLNPWPEVIARLGGEK